MSFMKRLFGTTGTGDGARSARGRVGSDAEDGDSDAFGQQIHRTQQYSARADRQIAKLEQLSGNLKRQAQQYMAQQNRSAARSCLLRAQQIDQQVLALQRQTQSVGQMAQNAQQTHQSVEAAGLMQDLAASQASYLEERGGARGIARQMRDVTRTVEQSREVQEAVTDALPEDLFTPTDEIEGVDALLDAMERETMQDLAPSAAPQTGYDLSPAPPTAAAMYGGGGGTGVAGDGAPGRSASAPLPPAAGGGGDLDYYASFLS